jgi:hypothetical protein
VFDKDKYFDVFIEYAKVDPEDILIRITAYNRGPESAKLHLIPTLWFRNTWSWRNGGPKPRLERTAAGSIRAISEDLGTRFLFLSGEPSLLFTENETNLQRIFGQPNKSQWTKDGIDSYIVHHRADAVNPAAVGTKAAAEYVVNIDPGNSASVRLRLTSQHASSVSGQFGQSFDKTFEKRISEADAFYGTVMAPALSDEEQSVARQALAGMLWSKQHYEFDLNEWLREHGVRPTVPGPRPNCRNIEWFHMINSDVISMPDKWEYPWYAAWDLAFHAVALAGVDGDFAKQQLDLLLREHYLHPNGQIPAYEWNFGDVNPPVHAWAALFVYTLEKQRRGEGDLEFLKHTFQKLVLNFTWWVNRKDPLGLNVFQGGFLGLDNIGVFDRSRPLPTGGTLEQADSTAWMALYCQNMLEMALELGLHDPVYEDLAYKFVEHFLWMAAAMDRVGVNQDELWDGEEGFFYDLVRLPDGSGHRMHVRSLVGLLPLCATTVIPTEALKCFPRFVKLVDSFLRRSPELTENITSPRVPGIAGRRMLALLNQSKLERVLAHMLDEEQFLSPFGIRSLSRAHKDHPYILRLGQTEYSVAYEPAESSLPLFGGNSNWRGPIWFPVNALIIRALLHFYMYYGDSFRVECPTGSGRQMTLFEVAKDLTARLSSIFLPDAEGRRPVFGGTEKMQTDPHWKDHLLFYEYFHGDNGAGIGASHQTGWTGLVGTLMNFMNRLTPEQLTEGDWREQIFIPSVNAVGRVA